MYRVLAGKDEVGPVVHERGAVCLGRARQRAHREGVHRERIRRIRFGGVDLIERRAIDDRVGPRLVDGARHRVDVGYIKRRPPVGKDVLVGERTDDGVGKLSGGAGDEHAAAHATHSAMLFTTCSCCAAVSSGKIGSASTSADAASAFGNAPAAVGRCAKHGCRWNGTG